MKYTTGYKYQLREKLLYHCCFILSKFTISTAWITLDDSGILIINEGYAWDGPSGPTIDSKCGMRGSLIHDALFQIMRLGLLDRSNFHNANKELHSILIADGMSRLRAWIWFKGVEQFSYKYILPDYEPEILEAP